MKIVDTINFKGEKLSIEYNDFNYILGTYDTLPESREIEILNIFCGAGYEITDLFSGDEKNEIIQTILNE